jgi:hypothetical protein
MQALEVHSQYALPMGSQKRSLARLCGLVVLWIAVFGLLYFVLAEYTGDFALLLFVVTVPVTVMHRALSPSWKGWARYFMKDAAYGSLKEAGIEYRTVFGKESFVPWSQIDLAEYSPSNGRVKVYRDNKSLPIQFGRCDAEDESLRYLKEKIQSSGGAFIELPSLPWWHIRLG